MHNHPCEPCSSIDQYRKRLTEAQKAAGYVMDGQTLRQRCRSCGALLIKNQCPVDKKDCGR